MQIIYGTLMVKIYIAFNSRHFNGKKYIAFQVKYMTLKW